MLDKRDEKSYEVIRMGTDDGKRGLEMMIVTMLMLK